MIIAFVLTGRVLEEKSPPQHGPEHPHLMGLAPRTARLVRATPSTRCPLRPSSPATCSRCAGRESAGRRRGHLGRELHDARCRLPSTESMITGEPTPAAKRKGDRVLAGTIPQSGTLPLPRAASGRAGRPSPRSSASCREAQGSKAPVQRTVDKAALVFVPVVGAIASSRSSYWWLIAARRPSHRPSYPPSACSFIACPCAMGLATPRPSWSASVGRRRGAGAHQGRRRPRGSCARSTPS
jgi:Cu2+-exporting ATPase